MGSVRRPLAVLAAALVAVMPLSACSGGGGSDHTPPGPSSPPPPPPPPPPPLAPQSMTDVVYGTGQTQTGSKTLLLDIYQSGAVCSAPRPFVMLIHGGGFTTGSKNASDLRNIAAELVARGYVAISINYRLLGDNPLPSAEFQPLRADLLTAFNSVGYPNSANFTNAVASAFEDTLKALRWVSANAGQHCIEDTLAALWGSSAGAVIAMHVAYGLDEYSIVQSKPDVVIDYWGRLVQYGVIEQFDPPLFILHGDQDGTVLYQEALKLETEATAAQLPFSFYTVAGGGHGFGGVRIETVTVDGVSILDLTLDFIDEHLKTVSPLYETRTVPAAGGG